MGSRGAVCGTRVGTHIDSIGVGAVFEEEVDDGGGLGVGGKHQRGLRVVGRGEVDVRTGFHEEADEALVGHVAGHVEGVSTVHEGSQAEGRGWRRPRRPRRSRSPGDVDDLTRLEIPRRIQIARLVVAGRAGEPERVCAACNLGRRGQGHVRSDELVDGAVGAESRGAVADEAESHSLVHELLADEGKVGRVDSGVGDAHAHGSSEQVLHLGSVVVCVRVEGGGEQLRNAATFHAWLCHDRWGGRRTPQSCTFAGTQSSPCAHELS